jgi:Enoyl-(Acyl carrier protein) reductase
MTRSLAVEWARYGIRFNAIAPGPFPTEGALSRLMPTKEFEEAARHRHPLKRFGHPEELTNLAAYLISNQTGYINGECVVIDGGEWLAARENSIASLTCRMMLGEPSRRRSSNRVKASVTEIEETSGGSTQERFQKH